MQYGTTDRCTGGTASADSNNGNLPAGAVANDAATTFWTSANTALPHYWQYDFGAGVLWKISKITISSAADSGNIRIKDFNLQGSNDGTNWTTIYTGQMANSTNVQTFTFTNRIAYRYIRVNITSSYSAFPNYSHINEIEMFEGIYPQGGFSGVSNPWIFIKDMWDKHNKLWTPKGLVLPKDLSFQY